MKKFLYLALTAVLFMACESNGGGASGGDKKMVDEVSNKVISALGSSNAQTVHADLISMGFKKVEESAESPVRKLAPGKVIKDAQQYVEYSYNLPANYQSDDSPEFYQELARSKKLVVVLALVFENDKLIAAEGGCFISQAVSNYNSVYTNFSNNVYASIPSQANIAWQAIAYTMTNELQYTSHADFIKDFSSKQLMAVMEGCAFENGSQAVQYELSWQRSMDSNEARQQGYEPFCVGTFAFVYGK